MTGKNKDLKVIYNQDKEVTQKIDKISKDLSNIIEKIENNLTNENDKDTTNKKNN